VISRDDFDNMARQFPMYDALYPVPPGVVWGTTLTRLGIKSVVKKARGHSVRMRNLRLKA